MEFIKPDDIKIGTKYKPMGKRYVCTVTDILKTYSSSGDLVRVTYISKHNYLGQEVKREDVAVTIQRGFIK